MRGGISRWLAVAALATPAIGQTEVQRVLPDSPIVLGHFGDIVDLSDGTMAIASYTPDAVFLFEELGGEWIQSQRLEIFLTHVQGGHDGWQILDLEVSGDWLAVGIVRFYSDSTGGKPNQGEVQLFHRSGGIWYLSQVLIPDDMIEYDMFAWDLALDGGALIVGSPHFTNLMNGCSTCPGSVYVYELALNGSWEEVTRLFAPPTVSKSSFGRRVALEGTRALATGTSGNQFRKVEVLERLHGSWAIVDELVWGAEYPTGGEHAVALDGDTALIASPNFHSSTAVAEGAVLVWERDSTGWTWTDTWTPSDAQPGMFHSQSLALAGDDAIVAAPGDHLSNPVGSGSVYHYRRSHGVWQQAGKLVATRSVPYDFGTTVNLEGGTAVVGSFLVADLCPFIVPCSGAGYVFELAPTAQQFCACDAGPCGPSANFGGCVDSTGTSAFLVAGGSASVALDELRLEAHWMPSNEVALMFMGGAATTLPFEDGLLCVAPGPSGLYRLHVGSTGAGDLELGPGLVKWTHANLPPAGQIEAGDTWYVQCWYRDLASTCGGQSNLTNGVRVEFVP